MKRQRFNLSKYFGMILLLLGAWISASDSKAQGQDRTSSKKLTLVCSTTQIADFARNIVGDRWEVICVLAPGEDPHTYEVGNDDALSVARADLCLENGWNLEGHSWMKRLATNENKPLATCIKGVSPLMLFLICDTINDPHAWFDTKHAAIYVNNIL